MTPQPIALVLDAVSVHLAGHELPLVVAVHCGTGRCILQLSSQHPTPDALARWSETLTNPVVHAYRVLHETIVHLSMEGVIPGTGVQIDVFGDIRFTAHGIGGHLAPGDSTIIPLDELRKAAEEETR